MCAMHAAILDPSSSAVACAQGWSIPTYSLSILPPRTYVHVGQTGYAFANGLGQKSDNYITM